MIFSKRLCFLILALTLHAAAGNAQNAGVGYWTSHLPYNSATGVATNGNTIYAICKQAFFTCSVGGNEPPVPFSKIDGMSDIGMQYVAYDEVSQCLILVYSNGNIDLYKNNTFYNIPDLKLKNVPQPKTVYQVYTENGFAYLSTALGLLVLDLENNRIAQNYKYSIGNEQLTIKGFAGAGNQFYMIMATGLYTSDKHNPDIGNLDTWTRIDSTDTFAHIVNVQDRIFLGTNKKVYTITANAVQKVYTADSFIYHMDAGNNQLLIGTADQQGGLLKIMDMNYTVTDSFHCGDNSVQAVQPADGSIWVATPNGGLKKRAGADQVTPIFPDGPSSPYAFDLYAYDKNLYIAHGGYNTTYFANFSLNGISNYRDGKWTYYKHGVFTPFDYLKDFVAVARNEKTGMLYAGSYVNGLYMIDKDGVATAADQSVFDGSYAYGADAHDIISLALDKDDNLWVSLMFAKRQLYLKTPDNKWYAYVVPNISLGGAIVTDDSGLVWMASSSGEGLSGYSTNNTPADVSDDKVYHFVTGKGKGNLPSNKVNCLAKDHNNQIWAGTNNGIAIIKSCTTNGTSAPTCDAELPYVNYATFSGNLFAGSDVKTIAVDAIDRKWVGTADGAWLLSPDAQQVIEHFTTDNSPLPSNFIQKIAVDNATGDVYIGTDNGLASYHGTATEGSTDNQQVTIFPNPVPPGYTGIIAIKGLVTNADVRIADINGQLVYKTTAIGGQAIWNGKDYTGHRPQTGIYTVFVSSKDGRHTYTGKIAFIQ